MPSATVTIRKLRNVESRVDLSVPTHKEIPGLLTTTVEYHVVVVSDQAVFKSPKHKDTDVVQFMITKHYDDFENLRRKLVSGFQGTTFPQLPKSIFSFGDSAINERQVALEGFLKYVASKSKCVLCRPTLEFLGVDPLKIKSHEVVSEGDRPPHYGLFEDEPKKPTTPISRRKLPANTRAPDLFGQAEFEDTDDLFLAAAETSPQHKSETTPKYKAEMETEEEDFLFTRTPSTDMETGLKLFANQDYGDKVNDDRDLFLLPRRQPEGAAALDPSPDDDADLLNIDDDFEQLLSMSTKPKVASNKPCVPSKTTPASKEAHSPSGCTSGHEKPLKPQLAPKPQMAPKPQLAPKPKLLQKQTVEPLKAIQIDSDDILKYIVDNTLDAGSDLDLFS